MFDLRLRLQKHLAALVETTPMDIAPFPHLELSNVFPAELYSEVIDNLPETRFYGELKHADALLPNGRSARRKLELRPARLRCLPSKLCVFWTAIAEALTSKMVMQAYRSKFSQILAERRSDSLVNAPFRPAAMLLRDLAGYKISIHTDSFRKAITTQYYLPRDFSQAHLGTSFHTDEKGIFTNSRTLEFAPNTGYAFPVTENSWHSVQQTSDTHGERNSIMLIYYVDQGLLGESINWAKQFGQDLLHYTSRSQSSDTGSL
jgi:hypothetical protein